MPPCSETWLEPLDPFWPDTLGWPGWTVPVGGLCGFGPGEGSDGGWSIPRWVPEGWKIRTVTRRSAGSATGCAWEVPHAYWPAVVSGQSGLWPGALRTRTGPIWFAIHRARRAESRTFSAASPSIDALPSIWT